MKTALAPIVLALGLGGCAGFNPVNLTPQQQANLQLEITLGKQVVQATANLFCVIEPTTSKIIGILDTSKGTAAGLQKADAATAALCATAIKGA